MALKGGARAERLVAGPFRLDDALARDRAAGPVTAQAGCLASEAPYRDDLPLPLAGDLGDPYAGAVAPGLPGGGSVVCRFRDLGRRWYPA